MTTPAGWYPDPYDASQLRYWDGSVWTESVTPAAAPAGGETQQVWGEPGAPGSYGAQDPQAAHGGYGPAGAYGGQPGYEAQGAYGATAGYGTPGGTGRPDAYGATLAPVAAPGSGLGDVGDWLSATFSRLFERIVPMAILLAAVPVVGFIVLAILARSLIAGITITGADEPGGGEVSGLVGSRFLLLFAVAVVAVVVAMVCWLASNHQMYAAHAGQPQSVGASLTTGLRRLPRTIGWGLVLLALILAIYVVMVVALVAVVAAAVGSDDANPLVLLLLFPLGLVFVAFAAWLWVKLAFWGVALSVGPAGTNPFSASWRVSRDRFWPVFGRLLLLFVIVWLISTVFNFAAQIGFGTAMSTLFQVDPITGDVLVNGQPVEDQSVIDFGDLVPGPLWFALIAIVYTVSQAVSQAIGISATAGLYLRGGGPGEI